jgi:tRNA A-37 threonylcarbamoyl transferase component Bud32/tetratricopeptide (TPR) repeat protein
MRDQRPLDPRLEDTEPQPLVDADLAGLTFGRYVVRDVIGSGTMGAVYRAYDPELQREIALKVLHAARGDADERLLQKAQATARIRHPNVLTVYDVGTVDKRVFLAMELIDGTTLDKWLDKRRDKRRPVADVLRVFRAAGEGLRAAHVAGVVHRDFKAANVLVGDDGRVCVTDFGLAGATSTASADQLSFCVALFTALYGTPPLEERTVEAWQRLERRLRRGAPATVRHVLRRGLALDPAARFPDMGALLSALAPRRQLRLMALGLLAVTGLAVTLLLVPRLRAREQVKRCQKAESKVAALWSAPLKAKLEHALGQAQGSTAWATAKAGLDRWTSDWTRLHAETCAMGVRPDVASQSLFDLRMECLNARLQEASATLHVLTTLPKAAKYTQSALQGLQSIDSCADGAALGRPLRPAATPEALRPVSEAVARARADYAVESCRESLTEAQNAAADAHALSALVLESEARILVGLSQMCLGDRRAARVSFMDTAVLAEQAQSYERVTAAYLQLVNYAAEFSQYDEAEHWMQLARETMAAHPSSIKQQGELEYNECYLPLARSHPAEAEPHCRRARELFRQLPTRMPFEADAAQMLGSALGRQARFAEAAEAYRDAQQLFRQIRGPESRGEIRVLEALADDETEQDHLATALALQQRVVEHDTDAFPEELSGDLAFYGQLLTEVGRAKEALPFLERALAAAERITAQHGFETGVARAALGQAYLALGQPQVAVGYLETARRMIPAEGNEDLLAEFDFTLAKALWNATPHHARAAGLARQSLEFLRAHPLGALRARHLREIEAWLQPREK